VSDNWNKLGYARGTSGEGHHRGGKNDVFIQGRERAGEETAQGEEWIFKERSVETGCAVGGPARSKSRCRGCFKDCDQRRKNREIKRVVGVTGLKEGDRSPKKR